MVNKGPFMEWLGGTVTNTGTNVEIDEIVTPVSKTEELAMLIHCIIIRLPEPQFSAGVWTSQEGAISQASHEGDAVIPDINNSDILYRVAKFAQEGVLAGTWTRFEDGPEVVYFDPPILYAKSYIYFELDKSANTANDTGSCKIGYTLEKVSKDAFISALVG